MQVSVVIPAFNAAPFVEQAIESCLLQRDDALDLEVIVVDNGSTDGTADLVRRRFAGDVVVLSESVRGIAPARNTGIARSSGSLVALLDADDVWEVGKLALQVSLVESRPDVALVFCHGVEFADPPGSWPCRDQPRPFVIGSAMLATREAIERVGPFPPFRSGEFIAWFGVSQALGIRHEVLPQVLVRRRVHGLNTTRERSAVADYPLAMRWLLERRRSILADGNHES